VRRRGDAEDGRGQPGASLQLRGALGRRSGEHHRLEELPRHAERH
jgi:hypothetical protein